MDIKTGISQQNLQFNEKTNYNYGIKMGKSDRQNTPLKTLNIIHLNKTSIHLDIYVKYKYSLIRVKSTIKLDELKQKHKKW